jgi:hypothetical protein
MTWQAWKPEFDAERKLKDVLAEMPRDNADKIPWQVWLLENPDSPFAFPGSINLFRHDCMHVLLCASFWPEDEAFVVGYTMGTSKWSSRWSLKIFMWLTTWFYPGVYRWNKELLRSFEDGFNRGNAFGMRNLNSFPFEDYTDLSLAQLRKLVGVDWLDTTVSYREWAKHWPIDRFKEFEHLKGEMPQPGKNPITYFLRKVFGGRKNAA